MTKSNKAWLHEHLNDPYVKQARAEGWRSRAVFKLMEIDERDRLLRPGMVVIDLGCAPGSWSQFAVQRIQPGGRLIALDVLGMAPVPAVEFLQGDFREPQVLRGLQDLLRGTKVDLVLSDMAPNISGIRGVDQARMTHLVELALDFAREYLNPGGDLLVKTFHGAGDAELRETMRRLFETVVVRKPGASRGRSAETYLVARKRRDRQSE